MTKPQRDPQTGRLQPGHSLSVIHGLYSLKGKGPAIRGVRALKRQLDALEAAIVRELPAPLNTRRLLLVKQIVRAERIAGLVELYLRKHGLARPDRLRRGVVEPHPVANLYMQTQAGERAALMVLGLDDKTTEKIKSALDIIAEHDSEKAEAQRKDQAAKRKARVTTGPGQAQSQGETAAGEKYRDDP